MGTRSMGASRTREVDGELNKEGVVEVREVVKRIEQFNHNHLGWITGAKHQIKNSKRKRERLMELISGGSLTHFTENSGYQLKVLSGQALALITPLMELFRHAALNLIYEISCNNLLGHL